MPETPASPLDVPHAPAKVVVIGGGIAGLAAAYRLTRTPGVEVILLEGSAALGGKLRRVDVGGIEVDVGAEAMLFRRPEAVDLAREVGLAEDLVHPATTSSNLWNRGRLVPMPRTLMGIPGDVRSLDGVLSAKGMARAALDPVLPASEIGEDTSVAALVEERLGTEVLDRLVEPLLGGVYAGHARELSLRATMPQVVGLLEHGRSLTRGAGKALAATTSSPTSLPTPVFAGIRGGVGRLSDALAAQVRQQGGSVRTGATVRDLAHRPGGGWNLVVGPARDPEVLACDAVVLAVPAAPAARLLSDVAPHAALELARIEYASMAIVTLAFATPGFPEIPGSGFLVPPVDGHQIKAATFSFAKWEWVREAGRRAEEDLLMVRVSIGRHRQESVLQVPDEDLVDLATAELGEAIGRPVRPVDTHVQRWGGGLPQYAVGHRGRVDTVRQVVASVPGLAVCGAAYDGLGIPACIASADLAVDQVVGQLRAVGRMGP